MRCLEHSFKEMAMKQTHYESFEDFERTELHAMRSFYQDMDDVLDTELFHQAQDRKIAELDFQMEQRVEW